ncbi:MAG TPA: hypothetical protein VEJ63_06950 [Planctomycetota bacterium]|nr:hypothetical protein [Planctomycetota bacterium]
MSQSPRASRRTSSPGLALILVVGVLTVLLVIAMAFHQSVQLEFKAAISARERESAETAARAGVHQAMAFLQYDVWGVNEKQAFVCAQPGGELHQESGAAFPDPSQPLPRPDGSVAFFTSTPKGFVRITRPVSKWRRPVLRIPLRDGWQNQDHPVPGVPSVDGDSHVRVVETDLSWVVNFSHSYKQKGAPNDLSRLDGFGGTPNDERIPVLSGAPFHDELLPGPFDHCDLWELRTDFNRRRLPGDAMLNGGQWIDGGWIGHYWAWPSMRRAEEFDYIDTRLCGDAVYRLFRSDLVAGEDAGDDAYLSFESGIDPAATSRSGVVNFAPYSPRRYLHDKAAATDVHPQCTQRPMKARHLGRITPGEIGDTRGGALNINQVNHTAAWERCVSPEGKPQFYNEAKWIYLYTPDGSHNVTLQRYAVTVIPEAGMPNANFAGPPAADDWPVTLEEAARTW